jgi:hypothetical protein
MCLLAGLEPGIFKILRFGYFPKLEISIMENLNAICMQAQYIKGKFETSLQVLKRELEKHLKFV